jgi:hypothetical protein
MGGGPVSDDFLRDEMRQALESRRPDRTAMLNRIAANRAAESSATENGATPNRATPNRAAPGLAAQPRPRARVARLAGSALAVLTVLGLGGVASWAMADSHDPTPAAAPPPVTASATPAAPSPSVVATEPAPPPSREVTTRPRTQAPTPSPSLVRGHPGDTQVEKGTLWSDGSIEDDGDSVVTLKPAADLTELDLTIRVTQTPGLTSLGVESSVDTVTATVTKQPDALLYRFTLKPGATLTAGEYKLTAKWSGKDRNAKDDTYEAYATSVERKRIHVYGNFIPKD